MTAPNSEARMIISQLQQLTSGDLTLLGEQAQRSMDNVVLSFLADAPAYTGLTVAANGTDKVTVQPGLMYSGGKGYPLRDVFTVDLAANIASTPADQTKIVLILAAPLEDEAVQESRTFLDASKKPANPRDPWPTITIATSPAVIRQAQIQKVAGDAAVQPEAPSFGASLCLVARVVVSNTAIVSITMEDETEITTLIEVASKAAALEAFKQVTEPAVASLLSSVASLAQQILILSGRGDLDQLTQRLNEIEERLSAANAVLRGADYFVDTSQSATGAAGYAALVQEGLRFPQDPAGTVDIPIAPVNPFASNVRVMDNKLMPSFIEVLGMMSPAAFDGDLIRSIIPPSYAQDVAMNTFGTFGSTFYRRGFALHRIRWGSSLQQILASQALKLLDPTPIFALPGYTFDTGWGDWRRYPYEFQRRNGFWRSLATRGYWLPVLSSPVIAPIPVLSQIVNPSSAMMITKIGIPIKKNGNADVRIVVTGLLNGDPDPNQTYIDITVPAANINPQLFPILQTYVNLPYPLLVGGGNGGISVKVMTTGQHSIRMLKDVVNSPYGQLGGPVKVRVGNAWIPLNGYREMALSLVVARFLGSSTRIPANPLQLAGGIDSVDIVAPSIVPEGCDISYEVQIAGNRIAIEEPDGAHPLLGRPSNMPLDIVLKHTEAVAPILDLDDAVAQVSRLATTLEHHSTSRSPTVPVDIIKQDFVLDGYNPTFHTLEARLKSGVSLATLTAPSTTTIEAMADGGTRVTYSWAVTDISAHAVRFKAVTSDATKTLVVRDTRFSGVA